MKVKIVFFYVLSSEVEEVVVSISDSTTLKELFEITQNSYADVSGYYPISMRYYHNHNLLPYIIKVNGEVDWEPTYENIKVVDFFHTHDIFYKFIQVKTVIT